MGFLCDIVSKLWVAAISSFISFHLLFSVLTIITTILQSPSIVSFLYLAGAHVFFFSICLFIPNSQVLRSRQSHERRTSWISKKNFIANKVLDLENLSNLENRILKSCQSNYSALLIPNIIKPCILSLFITFCPPQNCGMYFSVALIPLVMVSLPAPCS